MPPKTAPQRPRPAATAPTSTGAARIAADTPAGSGGGGDREHIEYHRDGTVWARGQVRGDQPTGYWEWYRKDGTRLRSGMFEGGKQVGEWTTYDRRGEVHKVTVLKPKTAGGATTTLAARRSTPASGKQPKSARPAAKRVTRGKVPPAAKRA